MHSAIENTNDFLIVYNGSTENAAIGHWPYCVMCVLYRNETKCVGKSRYGLYLPYAIFYTFRIIQIV